MNIPPALFADLHVLNEAVGGNGSEISGTLELLMAEAVRAVPSYLGLSVVIHEDDAQVEMTTLEEGPEQYPIGSSLRLTAHGASPAVGERLVVIEIILYAATPGALVDLAADMIWLTGQPPADFRIDEDVVGPRRGSGSSLASWSIVNQARGVLMDGGFTLEESDLELDARASLARVPRHIAAAELLAGIHPREPGEPNPG